MISCHIGRFNDYKINVARIRGFGTYLTIISEKSENMKCIEYVAISLSYLLVLITFPFSLCCCFKIVDEYERAVILRMGRLRSGEARGPGTFFILPCVDEYYKVDLRTLIFDVPPQAVLTKDSVTVIVDAVIFAKVKDPLKCVINVYNYKDATRQLGMTTLRNILGTKTLVELQTERMAIAQAMQKLLDEATDPWGVDVERIEITDVGLPPDMQKSMAAEAEAGREARAKLIAAEGELKASRALKEAASVITESPAALQLRYLQTLATIAGQQNSTIIFPIPIDIISQFMKRK